MILLKQFSAVAILGFSLLLHGNPACALGIGDKVQHIELANGLKVLMLERHTSPTISFSLCFKTGAVDENSGTTGVAHLLEHMLFKGTKTIGTRDFKAEQKLLARIDEIAIQLDNERRRGSAGDTARIALLAQELKKLQEQENALIIENEFDTIYTRNGAEGMNAGTGYDITSYMVSLPSNRLELWMRLESERFANPVFRQYYAERDVVIEEMRQSYETKPDRLLSTQLLAAAFQAHPYGRPIIGWKSDIEFLPRSVCEEFFKNRYSLANAVVAVVGDIDSEQTKKLFERYFARIPARRAEEPFISQEPEQRGERRCEVRFDAEPQVLIGFHKPTFPARDDYVFDLLDALLSNGRTSRLYSQLVLTKRIASSVDTSNGFPGARFPNLFIIRAVPLKGVACTDLEKAIYAEIDRLVRSPIPPAELAKVKKQFLADFVRNLDSNQELSHTMAYYQIVCNDWRYVEKSLAVIESISSEEIQTAAKKYLVPRNRTVATLVKEAHNE
ncbi:MAG: insulinase family protein [Deltaproteobacteria bacterium]|nr:insulinase family protein [Deltaproteobacteria bacterium]